MRTFPKAPPKGYPARLACWHVGMLVPQMLENPGKCPNNNSNKYWVTIDFYKNKNEAENARERFLIEGWIKQI